MQSQPDWGKRGVWAAYIIGVPTILLGLFAYFRPPDPTHAIRFDFLFRTVSIPVWLIISLLVLAMGLALAFRILSPRLTRTLSQEFKAAEIRPSKPTDLQSPSKPPVHIAIKAGQLIIPSPDQLEIHVEADNSAITLRVDNNRLDAIHHLDAIVYSAYSFDGRQNQFRTHAAATGARMQSPNVVGPSESSQAFVLVHHPTGKDQLQLGNDTERTMKWPENDKANIQKWKLNVSFGARAYSNTIPPTGEVFQPAKFDLIVGWNKISNQLSVEKA
jgi:hypothetical protein